MTLSLARYPTCFLRCYPPLTNPNYIEEGGYPFFSAVGSCCTTFSGNLVGLKMESTHHDMGNKQRNSPSLHLIGLEKGLILAGEEVQP
ncbi:MAG: hypothetical protein HQL62_00805 [Magnetococcales bacterium]|nr:hypothetical protein [Magnetococcales bacterium]